MLYKFKSQNTGDVIMLETNGRLILDIIGKQHGPKGIILADEMPGAIKALKAAIALEAAGDVEVRTLLDDGLGLHHRALPFIDMLQRSHASGNVVVWGV